jgi:putative DNA primase/helicase
VAPYPPSGVPREASATGVADSAPTGVDARPARKRAPRKKAPVQTTPRDGEVPDSGLRGHKRMASRFAQAFRGTFIHTPGRGWLEFNGARYEDCGESRPWNAVHSVCLAALRELPDLPAHHRDALYEDIRRCDSSDATAGVLKHARHWPGIGHKDEQLDAHPGLFVVDNGTYDLYAHAFRPSDPADLMTLAGGVAYDPDADCPLYDHLMSLYQPDPQVRAYLHRLGGAAMEGRQNLQNLIINYGSTGGNGKGTTQRAWMHVFGAYADVVDIGMLLARKGYDQYRDDKALLKGKRLLYPTEPSAGQKFDGGTVKALTGGDKVKGAQKYKSAVSFDPTWLIMLSTNNRVASPADGGMARRLKEIGWTYTIPDDAKRDDLDELLRAEGSGILNRLLAGWADYRTNGVQEPRYGPRGNRRLPGQHEPGPAVPGGMRGPEGRRGHPVGVAVQGILRLVPGQQRASFAV